MFSAGRTEAKTLSQACTTSSHKPVVIGLKKIGVGVTPQTERVIVIALSKSLALLLAVISRQHENSNRTIPVKDRLSQ